MYKTLLILSLTFLMINCKGFVAANEIIVNNQQELKKSLQDVKAGDIIILANGVWKDAQIHFSGKGTENKPIMLKAQESGKVFLEGQSYLKLAGEYLIVEGLHFRNGFTPNNTVIDFKIDKDSLANYSRVTNCVIKEFNQLNRYKQDHWVELWGRHNQLDHNYIAGKSNQGPTIRVYLSGNENIRNYHQITNNHFGPRPRKGGPKAETMQIGDSYTSMTPSYVNVSNNYFEKCNGEVEVISSKSNFNEFRNNVFYQCEGSLVMRHGNYCNIDGNFFIGSDESEFVGGIRVINTGHWITNNYFYKLKADEFRGPLAIMNGIPKSPLNRYNQVTDVVVAYNTWVDCTSPWQFSVGANMNKKDVLPAREIRSARPKRTLLANNIIYNHQAVKPPIKTYDKVDGIVFKSNLVDNQGIDFESFAGFKSISLEMNKTSDWLYNPTGQKDLESVYTGFGFEEIQNDLLGNSRSDKNRIGAVSNFDQTKGFNFDKSNYGPDWYSPETPKTTQQIITMSSDSEDMSEKIEQANHGDVIELESGSYKLNQPLKINKKITIRSKDKNSKAQVVYSGSENSPAFEMNPKGHLILENIILQGNKKQQAFASLKKDMSFAYNLFVKNSQIIGFKKVLKAYKGSFADTISFSGSTIKNGISGIELAAETNDKGDYNAEFVFIEDCSFENIQSDVVNFYRGGYDESTIGGNLFVRGSSFKNCGKQEPSKILLKTRGIINVEIANNSFENNPVKLIALLWGEKNNRHFANETKRSGEIRVDKYLKQKLVY